MANLQQCAHIWLMESFPNLFCYGKANFGQGIKNMSMLLECGEALFQRWHPCFRNSSAFADAFFWMVQDTRLVQAAGNDLERHIMQPLVLSWSEIEVSNLIRTTKDKARGVYYCDERISALVWHGTLLLKQLEGNVYSLARATEMMWGRIIIWSLPSLLLSIMISESNVHVIKAIVGPISVKLFNRFNSEEAGSVKGTNTLMLSWVLSALAHACMDKLLGFKSDYNGVSCRDKGMFGRIRGYLGTVTSNEPGLITFNLVIWLMNAPMLNKMHNGLKSKGFREWVGSVGVSGGTYHGHGE